MKSKINSNTKRNQADNVTDKQVWEFSNGEQQKKKKTVYKRLAKTDVDTHLHFETKRLSEIASGTFDSGLAIYFRMQVK